MGKRYTHKAKKHTIDIINERVLQALEKGIIPWEQPWKAGAINQPLNARTGDFYRGSNVMLLTLAQRVHGFKHNIWLTFLQAKELKGHVMKGQQATGIVVKLGQYEKKVENENTGELEKETRQFLRHFNVWNIEQCEGIDISHYLEDIDKLNPFTSIQSGRDIVEAYEDKPVIQHIKQNRAFYKPSEDSITMPLPEQFKQNESYYSTLFHEMAHSTGHQTRLKRDSICHTAYFGSHDYSYEELIAECTANYLCNIAGIANEFTDRNTDAYIQSWIKALKGKEKRNWLFKAFSEAEKATNYILGIKPEYDN